MMEKTEKESGAMPEVVSFDFETYYTKAYSLSNIPTYAYVYHEDFNAYLVSVAGPNNFLWVGHPKDFDWSYFNGKIVVAHNLGFDGLVLKRLQEDGVVPEIHPAEMHCTADLAAYLKYPRALKMIAKFIFEEPELATAGKQAREKMQHTPVDQLKNDPEILKYAANDALLCRRLWLECEHEWPQEERDISRITRESGWTGVKIDMAYVEDCVRRLSERLFQFGREIPWDWDPDKTPLSRTRIVETAQSTIDEERALTAEEISAISDTNNSEEIYIRLNKLWGSKKGREHGVQLCGDDRVRKYIWYPASFAKDDPECTAWEDEYAGRFEWINAVRNWRRHNMLLQKFQHLQKFTNADGRYRVQLRYCGAHTGRWSGAGFFNVQNLPRKELFCALDANKNEIEGTGFDLRRCLLGNFYLTDYAQIEARGLVALVRDERILPKLRAGMSIYQAHAEATTGQTWKDLKKENFPLYQAKKMEVLLLGYQGGATKLASAAYLMTKDSKDPSGVIRWTDKEALGVVTGFRTDNPIVGFWERLDQLVKAAAFRKDPCLIIKLPSGRLMRYWNPRMRTVTCIVKDENGKDKLVKKTSVFTQHVRNDPSSFRTAFGGNMTENVVSGMCRDVLRDGWLALTRAGYHVAFTAHDEYIIDLKPGQTPEEADRIILDANNNSWAAFIPLALEGKLSPCYTK